MSRKGFFQVNLPRFGGGGCQSYTLGPELDQTQLSGALLPSEPV